MADDLRERIERGDLAAFLDPALPLHLLAEPNAQWWDKGVWFAWRNVVSGYAQAMPTLGREGLAVEVMRWASPLMMDHPKVNALAVRSDIRKARNLYDGPDFSHWINEAFCDVAVHVEDYQRHALDLARRLRALIPDSYAPSEVDAALAVLEQYV